MTQAAYRTALITGASSGIGTAFATLLAESRINLVITARREDRLRSLADELTERHGVHVDIIPLDLGAHGGANELYRKVCELDRVVDIVVNNAGFGLYGKTWEQPLERVQAMVELNMAAVTTLTHCFANDMVKRGHGRILQVASIGAYQPSPLYAVYSATKSYVLAFSVAMNHELKGSGVAVTTLCPGLTESEFHETAKHLKPKAMDHIMMSARDVAKIGLDAMYKGREVVTPGVANKLSGGLVKILPRSWATAIAGKTMEGKREE